VIARDLEGEGHPADDESRIGFSSHSKAALRQTFDMNGQSVEGVVFCGGLSRRMGTDKAELLAPVSARTSETKRTLLENAIEVLDQVAPRVFLASGETARYAELGRECVLDVQTDVGPLAGLAAALEACESTWLCVLACDMPRVESELISRLLEHAREHELDVCLLESSVGLEPLCGVYNRRCAVAVRESIANGERRMTAFHAGDLKVGTLHESEFRGQNDLAQNLNTQADYARVMNKEKPSDSAGERS
jgi:molybdopterin-guanine dinucleotide biosynthesis protein A